MEQLINTMLANAQMPQIPQVGKKGEASGQKDGFQKLLEQKQTDASQAPGQEKAETTQKPQDAQDAEKTPEADTEVPAAPKSEKELENQMALAAMAMLQNPVVPVEQAMTPEAQAEAAADDIAPLMAETAPAPEVRSFVPEAEETEVPEAEGGPQRVTRHAEARAPEAADTEESGEPQGAEIETPVFEDVKAVPVKVGEAPRTAEAEEPLEKQIAPRLTEALQNGETRVELQLTPENLGKVTVEMTWGKEGNLVVQIHAENRGTQDLLSRSTTELAQLLGREARQEVRVEVPRQEESQRQDLYEQQQEHHQRHQQEQRRRQERSGEDFLQQLRLGLIPMDGE